MIGSTHILPLHSLLLEILEIQRRPGGSECEPFANAEHYESWPVINICEYSIFEWLHCHERHLLLQVFHGLFKILLLLLRGY